VDAVLSKPVSAPKFPLTGKYTANFARLHMRFPRYWQGNLLRSVHFDC
jgi:hypothetical protein